MTYSILFSGNCPHIPHLFQLYMTFWAFVLYCSLFELLLSLNQNGLSRYVVIMSLFSFGSHFTVSLELLVDPLWVHFVLGCSLGELIQG